MAIDAKVSFLRQIEKGLEDKLTQKDMQKMMAAVSDVMQHFRMEELRQDILYMEDDLLNAFVASMKVQGRSEKTIERYKYVLGKFRRTLATGLARKGMPIQEVSALLGHEKLDTTMGYVNIDSEDTKYKYRRCV